MSPALTRPKTGDVELHLHRARVERLLAARRGEVKREAFAGVDEIPQMADPMPQTAPARSSACQRTRQAGIAAPARPMAPIVRRADLSRVAFVLNEGLPKDVAGQAMRDSGGGIRVELCGSVLAGLTTNDRESWLTLFHEIAHVVFGDVDRPTMTPGERDAREVRAEAFAVFMVAAINEVLVQSVVRAAHPRRIRAVPVPGKAFVSFRSSAVGGAS